MNIRRGMEWPTLKSYPEYFITNYLDLNKYVPNSRLSVRRTNAPTNIITHLEVAYTTDGPYTRYPEGNRKIRN